MYSRSGFSRPSWVSGTWTNALIRSIYSRTCLSKCRGASKYMALTVGEGGVKMLALLSVFIKSLCDFSISSIACNTFARSFALSAAFPQQTNLIQKKAIRCESIRWRPLMLITAALIFLAVVISSRLK